MSADAWVVCPRCKSQYIKRRQDAQRKLDTEYGKIPVDEWLKMQRECALPEANIEPTFEEYYSIGITASGTFVVDYSGACRVCGLSKAFRHHEDINIQ